MRPEGYNKPITVGDISNLNPPPPWVSMVQAEIPDGWDWLIHQAAEGVPSEISYIEENWTALEIAKAVAIRQVNNRPMDDPNKKQFGF